MRHMEGSGTFAFTVSILLSMQVLLGRLVKGGLLLSNCAYTSLLKWLKSSDGSRIVGACVFTTPQATVASSCASQIGERNFISQACSGLMPQMP